MGRGKPTRGAAERAHTSGAGSATLVGDYSHASSRTQPTRGHPGCRAPVAGNYNATTTCVWRLRNNNHPTQPYADDDGIASWSSGYTGRAATSLGDMDYDDRFEGPDPPPVQDIEALLNDFSVKVDQRLQATKDELVAAQKELLRRYHVGAQKEVEELRAEVKDNSSDIRDLKTANEQFKQEQTNVHVWFFDFEPHTSELNSC